MMIPVGAKISVTEGFYAHVGVHLGNGRVFHHHWRNGTEIIPLQGFANGNKVSVLTQGMPNTHALMYRAQQLLSVRRPYNLWNYNCEHAASFVRDGVASSPQLAAYGLAAFCLGGLLLLSRSRVQ
jgi:hypothetical protein